MTLLEIRAITNLVQVGPQGVRLRTDVARSETPLVASGGDG
jgi:hypothetical protein